MNNENNLEYITQNSYKTLLWDYLRKNNLENYSNIIKNGLHENKSPFMDSNNANLLYKKLYNLSLVRKEATIIKTQKHSNIMLASTNNYSAFWNISNDKDIYEQDILLDEKKINYEFKNLSSFLKVQEDLVYDHFSNIEEIVLNHFSKTFSKAEEKAFVIGNGIDEMLGITVDDEIESLDVDSNFSIDDLKALFFSLDPIYRENAKWIMNDKTALYLQTLKDNNGAYLWNIYDNKFMGKEVLISNHMPDIIAGSKVIAFGDFSNYVLIERGLLTIKRFSEKFILSGHIGFIVSEFLDGKLVDKKSVKTLKIKG